jgi:hypothetical protein
MGYGDRDIDVTPRSPIMHIGDLLIPEAPMAGLRKRSSAADAFSARL